MADLLPTIRQRFFDQNGVPLVGGKVYFYEAGTSTPKDTFTDVDGTILNTNPIILDANAECDVWIGSGSYKIVLTDANDIQLWSRDNIRFPSQALFDHEADTEAHEAENITYDPSVSNLLGTDVQAAIDELKEDIEDVQTAADAALTDHLIDPSMAHIADAIHFDNTGTGLSATNVQDALTEIKAGEFKTTYLKYVTATNVSGQSYNSASYGTVFLNTQEGDTSFCSLSSNQFTLQPGTYKVHGFVPMSFTGLSSSTTGKIKLRNITDSTDQIIGTSGRATEANGRDGDKMIVVGLLTITVETVFELQVRGTSLQLGYAVNAGDNEIYSTIEITKSA